MSERKLTRGGLDDIAPNNSNKAARSQMISPNEPEKKERKPEKLEPVVKGAIKQKPSIFTKFKDSFLGEGENIGEFIMYDILVPALRNTLSDMGFGIVDMLFGNGRDYGRNSSRIVRDRGHSYIDYRGVSNRDRGRDRGREDRRELSRSDRARHEFGNVLYRSRREAEDVLYRLADLIEEYGEATVAAFYELSGIESMPPDSNHGWTSLSEAYTDTARGGFVIRFPPTRPL